MANYPTLSNTSIDNNIQATVVLPRQLENFSGRILTMDEFDIISCYCSNTANIDWNKAFDSGEFTGIVFWKIHGDQYSVWALHDSLLYSPEYYINTPRPTTNAMKMRNIIEDHLKEHPELGITIDQFI